ncbi:MAG: ABC-type transport auxiliary lipoprotein family protein, partial [Desulfovibrio sp.]
MKIMAILMLALGLCACGRSTPTNYYLLESSPGQIQAESLPAGTLRVAMVEGPNYLNRNNIVSRVKGEPRLILAEFHLWAEAGSIGGRWVISGTLPKPR